MKKDANALKKDANALKKDANGYASQSHSQTPERDSAAVRLKDGAAAESLLPKERMRANEELKTTSAIKGSLAEWTKFRNDLGEDGRPGVRAKAERKIAELQRLLLEG